MSKQLERLFNIFPAARSLQTQVIEYQNGDINIDFNNDKTSLIIFVGYETYWYEV